MPQLSDSVVVADGVAMTMRHGVLAPERGLWRALVPIRKNGHEYRPGDLMALDEQTAARFLALQEVEQVNG